MKFIWFTVEGLGLPVALKLKEEGHEVLVAQIQDKSLTLTTEEKKNKEDKEDPILKKRRLELYDGLLMKMDAVEVIKKLKNSKDKDWIILTDSNCTFQFTTMAQSLGYTGLIPTEEDRSFEVDRQKAKDIVAKNYPLLYVMDNQEFSTIEDGIQFLQENDNVYVLKSLGDSGETIVPKIDDPQLANQQIIDTLQEQKEAYEQNGFLLEQKILDGIELTPEAIFMDGKLVVTSLDIETKTMGGHEKGPNYGCGTNLIIKTDPDDKLNKMAFPKYVYDWAKSRKGIFIIDAGIIFDQRTGRAYFTEFCSQRFGWDSTPTELGMAGDDNYHTGAPFFEALLAGKNPLRKRFGVGIRLFNFNKDHDRYPEPDLSISWSEKAGPCLWFYDMKEKDGKMVSVGFQDDLGVATGVGDTIAEAIHEAYDEYAEQVSFKDLYFKAREDFVSMDYPQSVMTRLKYAVDHKLIQDNGITEELNGLMPNDKLREKAEEAGKEVTSMRGEIDSIKEEIKRAISE